jgi:predicted metal-dependent enzyme (double-stranded beta helix superfamily)
MGPLAVGASGTPAIVAAPSSGARPPAKLEERGQQRPPRRLIEGPGGKRTLGRLGRPEGATLRLHRPAVQYGVAELIAGVDRAIRDKPRSEIVAAVTSAVKKLLASPDAIDDSLILEKAERYSRTLLYRDPQRRFTVLLLTWRPGQASPIHDHDCWGVVGVVRGAISEVEYDRRDGKLIKSSRKEVARRGQVTSVNPPDSDVHRMANETRGLTVTIHVYGRDMTEANVYDEETGAARRVEMVFDRHAEV